MFNLEKIWNYVKHRDKTGYQTNLPNKKECLGDYVTNSKTISHDIIKMSCKLVFLFLEI
jgi:hypothetical protein